MSQQLPSNPNPVLIEKTAKRWKKHQLFAGIIFFAGIVLVGFGFGGSPDNVNRPLLISGVVVLIAGLLYGGIVETLAWWNHG